MGKYRQYGENKEKVLKNLVIFQHKKQGQPVLGNSSRKKWTARFR